MKNRAPFVMLLGLLWGGTALAQDSDPPQTVEAGRALYAVNCASCHGVNLEGQPDWRRRLPDGMMPAPPHDASGHTWHHPYADLFTITKGGIGAVVPNYESNMPAFGETLSDADITAILHYIVSTWPERQRAFFEEVTLNSGSVAQIR